MVYFDANIVRPNLNGSGGIPGGNSGDNAAGFGPVALYAGKAGEVRFKDLSLKDLNLRPAPPERTSSRFRSQRLDEFNYAWDAAVADFNRDGTQDIVSGPFIYFGPEYSARREVYLGHTFNASDQYVDNMVTHAADFTGDGWPDVLATESRAMVLYVNPKGEARRWTRYEVLPQVNTETTLLRDVDGDGKPEVLHGFGGGAAGGVVAIARPDPANPTARWPVTPIAAPAPGVPGIHGLGTGDVNGDGRMDILNSTGWWEQPGTRTADGFWIRHATPFTSAGGVSGGGGGTMVVFDVNGDGRNDVVTSLNAHGWGLAWFEQRRDAAGAITFEPHLIMGNNATTNAGNVLFSELHSGVEAADMDRDGVTDIVTGKRHWAHLESYSDPDPMGEAVVYWYRVVRNRNAPGGAEFVPELIHNRSGVGSQFEVVDLNNDGAQDVVTAGNRGTFVFWGTARAATR